MDWNSVKQFLKPDWRKIALFFILAFFSFFWSLVGDVTDPLRFIILPIYVVYFLPIFVLGYIPTGLTITGTSGIFLLIIILSIYWYILSCLIIWIYDKYKKK